MNRSSEAILALKPLTFHYKSDQTGTPQYGLIAEEVDKINPDLAVRDEQGQTIHGALRRGERDVVERISQRTQDGARTAEQD